MKTFKTLSPYLLILFLVISFSLPCSAFCADQEKKEQQLSAKEQKEIETWQEMTSPGEKHKHLEYFIGEWESTQKIWPEPGSEPDVYKQEIKVKSILGGRFTRAHIRIDVEIEGMALEGIVITGYDNYKQKFVSATYSNMSTNISFMSGTLDGSGKIRTDYGQDADFIRGLTHKVKALTRIINKDKYIYEYYQVDPEGKEFKAMEITYLRKKGE